MIIDNKFGLGQHVWFLYKDKGEVHIFDDYIASISIEKDGLLTYYTSEYFDEMREEELIDFEDKVGLYNKILELSESEEYKTTTSTSCSKKEN